MAQGRTEPELGTLPPGSRFSGEQEPPRPVERLANPLAMLRTKRGQQEMFLVNFTCPETGKRAAAVVPDEREREDSSSREVLCPACGWLHSVDVETGKMAESAQVRGNPG